MDDGDLIFPMFIGFVMGMLAMIVVMGIMGFMNNNTQELGQSICEEEHNMNFKSYNDGVLECKPMPKEKKYDGIKVRIGGD